MRTTAQWGFFFFFCIYASAGTSSVHTSSFHHMVASTLSLPTAYALRLAAERSLVSGGPGFPVGMQCGRAKAASLLLRGLCRSALWHRPDWRNLLSHLAALRGVLLVDICAVASWASPGTFSRFSRVNVATLHPLAVVLQPESSDPTHTDPTLMFFIRRSVLEIPLLVVSRDESEWRVTNDHQSSLSLTILYILMRRFCRKPSWNDNGR